MIGPEDYVFLEYIHCDREVFTHTDIEAMFVDLDNDFGIHHYTKYFWNHCDNDSINVDDDRMSMIEGALSCCAFYEGGHIVIHAFEEDCRVVIDCFLPNHIYTEALDKFIRSWLSGQRSTILSLQ